MGGDGYIHRMYGEAIFDIFKQVKELFDAACLLNPGKKIPVNIE